VDYAKKREAFGRSIINHQGLQWQLAEATTQLEASRMLTYRVYSNPIKLIKIIA